MKKIVCGAVLAVGIYGNCEGMMDNCRSEDLLGRLDLLLQEEKALQESRMLLVEGIKKKLLGEESKFDRDKLLENVNLAIKNDFTELLDESLEGNVDSLEFLSGRIYSGRLMNELIFDNLLFRELKERKRLIFQISVECYDNTYDVKRVIENIIEYCPEKKFLF